MHQRVNAVQDISVDFLCTYVVFLKPSLREVEKTSTFRMFVEMHLTVSTKLEDCAVILTRIPPNALSMHLYLRSWTIVTASFKVYHATSTIPLQRIQNSAARLIVRAKLQEHITPVLQSLHWLPINKGITFKVLLLLFKVRNGLAPTYLQNLISTKAHSSRNLHSSSTSHLCLSPAPRTHTR